MSTATRRRFAVLALALGLVALPSCGEETTPDEEPGAGTGTAAEVAALLVTEDDLGDGWTELVPDDPTITFEDGVVTDENREYLPRIMFCPDASAESQRTAEGLEWQAFRQLDFDTGMARPTAEPTPGSPPPKHHLVFLQEFLLRDADGAEGVAETYTALAEGMEACLGRSEYPDGETGRSKPLAVPDLGEEATGTREIVVEPGPRKRSATWDLRNVLVRDGEYLLAVTFAEIRSPGVARQFSDTEVDGLFGTVAALLP